jgi:hypothetical protein
MSFRFKPGMFCSLALEEHERDEVAMKANQLLDAHIATLPEVKGWNQDDDLNTVIWFPKKNADYQSTHRARLWGLEEIKQKKCEHVVVDVKYSKMMRGVEGWIGKCEKCGRLMTPKWEEV